MYEQILEYIRWSDRADFWAFFHQCWNLLPLSYHLKLKYPNQILQAYEKPDKIPDLHELVYTQVLTKQSALFNSWKEMNRVSNDMGVPFRCVTQWATYQTGKLKDTLGLPILPVNPVLHTEVKGLISASPPLAVVPVVVNSVVEPSGSASAVSHTTAGPRKRSVKLPLSV
jgi:hypothetical protein